MAYYISVASFNREKNDQMWEKIFNGKWEEEVAKQKIEIEHELDELDENVRIDLDYELQQKEEYLRERQYKLRDFKKEVDKLKKAISEDNKEAILDGVETVDSIITKIYESKSYFGTRYPFHEYFSALFGIVLGLDIENEFEDTLESVPFAKWVELYKKIDSGAAIKAITATQDDPEDIEVIQSYADLIRHMRDIVKLCIETKSELRIFDELHESGIEVLANGRAREIIDTFIYPQN